MSLKSLFDRLRGKKPLDGDEATLLHLRRAGSDLGKAHEIEFFLYFPTREGAEEVASQIRVAGFEANVELSAKGDNWLCFATKKMVPDVETLQRIRKEFDALCGRLGGEYDGWGTPLEK